MSDCCHNFGCCKARTVFCDPTTNCRLRDNINVYHEEVMRMGCYYGILRTTPPIPERERDPVPLPVPVKHRQPSKRRKIPPYTYLFPDKPPTAISEADKKHKKKTSDSDNKPNDLCAYAY